MLRVKNISISFTRYTKKRKRQTLSPVSDISLDVQAGEVVALIGASGAGKSLLAHALLGLLPKNATMTGEYRFKGEHIGPKRIKELRGRDIALIPQSISYLNPLIKVRKQVYRSARLSGRCHCTAGERCDKAFARYNLAESVKSMYPFQVSGGMARRVLTATATAGKADLIIADEPTTGLDPKVATQSLKHLRELAEQGKGVLLITHDLENAVRFSDTIVVLYNGTTVEVTQAAALHEGKSILHPYTRALWQALPKNGFTALPPAPPSVGDSRNACNFAPRCHIATEACKKSIPTLRSINGTMVRCFHARS